MVNIYSTYSIKPNGRKWPKFKRINAVLQQRIWNSQPFQQELFALLMVLDEQYEKWYNVAIRTNEDHKVFQKIEKVEIATASKILSEQEVYKFRIESYLPRLLYEVLLKTTGLDYFFYSEGLRTNTQIKWAWLELRRNLLLFTIHVGLSYGVPILLANINSYFMVLLVPSIMFNVIHGYRQSKMFYFLNLTRNLLGLKSNNS
jgi:hypothetical protein